MIANLVIVREVDHMAPLFRLTLYVGGVGFSLAETRADDMTEAADRFAERLRRALDAAGQ